jgi:hypothetical protein
MIGFEPSLEFGGGGARKFGPLEGQGRIITSLYVKGRRCHDICDAPAAPRGWA